MEVQPLSEWARKATCSALKVAPLRLQLVKDGQLGPGTILGVAMPLLAQMIVEGRSEERGGHELKDADRDR